MGRLGSLKPGPAAPDGVGDGRDRLVLPHHALVEGGLQPHQLLDLALHQAGDRARPSSGDTTSAMSSASTSSFKKRVLGLQLGQVLVGLLDPALQVGQLAVADGRRAGQIAVALEAGRLLFLARSSPPAAG